MASLMITAAEVAGIMDCSERYGYMIIKQLNQELEQKGFITMRGRVSRRYFFERTGIQGEEGHDAAIKPAPGLGDRDGQAGSDT